MGISKIWVFGEANEAGASAGTLELLTKARTLADTVDVVMVGDASAVAGDLGAHGATIVHTIADADGVSHLVPLLFEPGGSDEMKGEVSGALGGRHDDRSAAIRDDAALQLVERVRDHPRPEDIVHRNGVAVHRVGVEACELPDADRDLRELLGLGAVFVHVPLCDHRVGADE